MTDFLRLSALPLLGLCLFAHPAVAQDIRSYTKTERFRRAARRWHRCGLDQAALRPGGIPHLLLGKASRAMMEAELSNVGFCPYVVFIYEACW
jgi:hypothetical protein